MVIYGVALLSICYLVGDSLTAPALLVPFVGNSQGTFVERPVYLPALESGIGGNLPSTTAAVTTISGNELPGVSLRVDPPTINTRSI